MVNPPMPENKLISCIATMQRWMIEGIAVPASKPHGRSPKGLSVRLPKNK